MTVTACIPSLKNFVFIVPKMPVVEPFYKSSVKTTTNYINKISV